MKLLYNTIKRNINSSPLEYLHIKAGATLVDFHGWNLPVKYETPILDSSRYCRKYCSVFDVSHMLQTKITGKNALKLINNLTVADVENIAPNTGTLTLFPNETGGIIDDLIINKCNDDKEFYVVSNAARSDVDLPYMQKNAKQLGDVDIQVINNCLIAMQGPKSEEILQKLVEVDLSKLFFMDGIVAKINGFDCRITRCGYTGEDGFEISCSSPKSVEAIFNLDSNVKWAGLGERDILRLEGGMCLYGNDIDETTSPYSARLLWTVAKNRRKKADFPGAEILLNEVATKTPINNKFRVGLTKNTSGRAMKQGMDIYTPDLKKKIGNITSGSIAANCENLHCIGQGYIEMGFHQNGKEIAYVPKGKNPTKKNLNIATISKMPFIKSQYKTK